MSEPEVVHEKITIRNASGDLLYGDVRFLPSTQKQPVIIICHSFMAFKDWGFFPYIARKFAEAGFVSLTFNFSHNGVTGHGNRITDFERFARNTFSQELLDLKSVVDAVTGNEIVPDQINANRIGLLGHSRGGGISIVYAESDHRISTLVTWSAISTFDRWTSHQKERWRSEGFLPLAKNSTVSPLRLGIDLLHDVELNSKKLDIRSSAGKLTIPWLILHGHEDVTIPVKEAKLLYAESNKSKTDLSILDHVGHLYNAASENEDGYSTLHTILGVTTDWLQQKLQ